MRLAERPDAYERALAELDSRAAAGAGDPTAASPVDLRQWWAEQNGVLASLADGAAADLTAAARSYTTSQPVDPALRSSLVRRVGKVLGQDVAEDLFGAVQGRGTRGRPSPNCPVDWSSTDSDGPGRDVAALGVTDVLDEGVVEDGTHEASLDGGDGDLLPDVDVGLDALTLVGDLALLDDALFATSAEQQDVDVAEAADVAEALGDASVPVLGVLVTAVRSGVREGRLVSRGDTDGARAVKNVAVDTGSRTVGFLAGAKAGAAAGAVVDAGTAGFSLGLGTVIGALAGGFLGVQGGKHVAQSIRLAPLVEARADACAALERYEQHLVRERDGVDGIAREQQRQVRERLAKEAAAAHQALREQFEVAREEMRAAGRFDAWEILGEVRRNLRLLCDDLDSDVLAPADAPAPYLRLALRRELGRWERVAVRRASQVGGGQPADVAFWAIVAAAPHGRHCLQAHVQERLAARNRARSRMALVTAEQADSFARRCVAEAEDSREVLRRAVDGARRRLEPRTADLRQAHDKHSRERRAAGLQI